ncbi:SURF1 family protein [Motiliproteus coralliicola]|uniref:SURF1-like protein n=1 Tax=Motiliproteus coralliicola TaxID=2283196 RepID=A0A369WSH9_9GAMM|nr:SURF1 family protein [Motiliproteus coralliicola]RDE24521.1 SURF1 family protein [Motiliproteus coralliicola]
MSQSKDRPTPRTRRVCILLGALLLPILLGLGFWQLERAEQKQQLLERLQHSAAAPQLPSTAVTLPYPVKIRARLDRRFPLLLDNRTRDGRVGYELLLPFEEVSTGLYGVVNLGWVAASFDRQQLPDTTALVRDLADQDHTLAGLLVATDSGLMLSADRWSADWPKRIQQVDLNRLQELWQRPVYSAVLRLQQPLIDADTNWSVSVMPAYKHQGYALQWFALALLLAGYLFWWGWRRSPHADRESEQPHVQGGPNAQS